MPIFYHVDRSNHIIKDLLKQSNLINGLNKYCNNIIFDKKIFADGLSVHGTKYLMGGLSDQLAFTAYKEMVFELVRELYFPQAYSRLQSMFAFKDKSSVTSFVNGFVHRNDNCINFEVWTLETDNYQEFDMTWISQGEPNMNAIIQSAKQYWSGEKTKVPFMECLLKPNIKIVNEVKVEEQYNKTGEKIIVLKD